MFHIRSKRIRLLLVGLRDKGTFVPLGKLYKNEYHSCFHSHNNYYALFTPSCRYQYKLKRDGKQSTMTDERVMALEDVGFIWDSHGSAWMERWNELADYNNKNGHCNVPSNYAPNPQLATWVKVRLVVSISKSQLLISSQYTHCFRSCPEGSSRSGSSCVPAQGRRGSR